MAGLLSQRGLRPQSKVQRLKSKVGGQNRRGAPSSTDFVAQTLALFLLRQLDGAGHLGSIRDGLQGTPRLFRIAYHMDLGHAVRKRVAQ